MIFADKMLNAEMKVADQFVNVCLDTREIHTLDVLEETVFLILNVETIKLVKTTNVWILANCLVDLVLIVKSITMLLFVDVQEGSPEIHSRLE